MNNKTADKTHLKMQKKNFFVFPLNPTIGKFQMEKYNHECYQMNNLLLQKPNKQCKRIFYEFFCLFDCSLIKSVSILRIKQPFFKTVD